MYTKLKQCTVVCCASVLVSLFATEAKAAVASGADETESSSSEQALMPGTIDLDVPAYLVRYLYREPDADEVPIKHWYEGWGVSFYWNPDLLAFRASSYVNKFNMSVKGVGVAISKDFNKKSALRIGGNFSAVDYKTAAGDEDKLKRINVSVDYVWNLSSTYYGYDLHRTDEWLLTTGVKGGRLIGEGDLFGSVNLGLQYRKNISNDMSFFIEPQFAFFSDKYDNQTSFYEVDPGMNLLMGLYFRMGNPKMIILDEQNKLLENSFFQVYGGNAIGSKTYAFKGMEGDYQRHKMNFGFNIGSWFNPSLGFRMGYFENLVGMGHSSLMDEKYGQTAYQTYRGGRLEAVLNPLTIFTNKTSLARFGLDLSVGYEVGTVNKHKDGYRNDWTKSGPEADRNHINYTAHGVTFAAQAKYFMSKNYALFAEGRFSSPIYTAKSEDGLTAFGDLNEHLMSWAVGMEYYISTFERYTRFQKGDTHESRTIGRLHNKNRWYVEGAAGIGTATHWGEYFNERVSASLAASLGVNYNDYSGLRMNGTVTRKYWERDDMVANQIKGNNYQFTFGLDYILNLTNLWMGRDVTNTRWSDIYLFAGPTIQLDPHHIRESFTLDNAYGAQFGAQFTRRLGKAVDLFLEPRYEWNVGAASRWNALAGLRLYQYREKNFHYRDSLARHDKQSWFLEVAGGAGMDMTGSLTKAKEETKEPDVDFRLGFGYRINPISSLRFNAQYTAFSLRNGNLNGRETVEFSADYMFNMLNLWYGNNPHRALQLQGYFGPTVNPDRIMSRACTEDIFYDWRFGMEAGVQLIYAPFQNVALFLEPRGVYYLSDYINKRGIEQNALKRDEHLDLYAGLIFYNQPGRLPIRGYNTVKSDSARSWYYDMAGGYSLTPSGRTGSFWHAFSPTGFVGLGHYISNYSSLRFRLGLSRNLYAEENRYKNKFITSLSLDYMYNLTNRIMGVNPYRRFDVSAFGGPVYEFYNSIKSKNDGWDKGFNWGFQGSWHVNNFIDLFAEGRNVMPYAHHSRYDGSLGVRLYQNKAKAEFYADSLPQHAYTWFMEAGGGVGSAFTDDQSQLDGIGKLSVGYRYNPISSVRINTAISARQEHGHHSRGEFGIDYMANLLNLWYGVDPYRRVNLRGFVGPTLSFDYFTETAKNLELNAAYNAGLQLTVGLTDNVDFLLEPRYLGFITGDEEGRGDVYAGLIFYNQRGLLPERGYRTINLDNERGWFMEVAGGASFAPDGREKGTLDHIDPMVNLAVGRFLGNYSAARLRGTVGYIRNKETNKEGREWIPEISADYIHNLTNHFLGINPYRRFDISLFAGPMVNFSGVQSGEMIPHWGVNGGGELSWHVNNFIDVFAEPRVSYLLNDDYYSRFEAMAGLRLYQNKTKNAQYAGSDAAHANTWFMELGAGAATFAINQNNPDFSAKGAIGYRFNPISSLRLMGSASTRTLNEVRRRSMEVNFDYMANVGNILYGVNPFRKANLRAFVGGQVTPDRFLDAKATRYLVGFDLGLQGTYSIANNMDLFLEPRMVTYMNNGDDPRLGLLAGLIFYNQRGLLAKQGLQTVDIEDNKTWFVEFGGGFSFSPDGRTKKSVMKNIDKSFQFAVGNHIDSYSSLRGRVTANFVTTPEYNKDKGFWNDELSLDYMYNLSNGVMGLNPYRRFDLNIFAGPVARINGIRNGDWATKWALNGGGQVSWHINDKWDLFGEGRVILSKSFSSRLEATGGVAYRFNKNSLYEASGSFMSDHMYAQVLFGGQLLAVEDLHKNPIKNYSALPSLNVNIGYRANKLIGVQAGLYSDHFQLTHRHKAQDNYSYGFRAEAVANILNLIKPSYDANENRFNWTASMGVQTGRMLYEDNSQKYNFGLTGATQLQYRCTDRSWAVLELRSQVVDNRKKLNMPITAQLGMMYNFNQSENISEAKGNTYVQAGAGMYESKTGIFEVGVGHEFTPIHGLRLLFANSFENVDNAGHWTSLTPDYVCNLTNIFLGHDDDTRHMDFSLLAGCDYVFSHAEGVDNYWGVNAGAQLTYNINKNFQIYAEPRVTYNFKDDKALDLKHEGLNLQTTLGLKYRLPEFNFKKNK